jgi:hypothetical protein
MTNKIYQKAIDNAKQLLTTGELNPILFAMIFGSPQNPNSTSPGPKQSPKTGIHKKTCTIVGCLNSAHAGIVLMCLQGHPMAPSWNGCCNTCEKHLKNVPSPGPKKGTVLCKNGSLCDYKNSPNGCMFKHDDICPECKNPKIDEKSFCGGDTCTNGMDD